MPTYWGILVKSAIDTETIEEAIDRIFSSHDYFLSVAVWGMMPKSQVDPETVEAAITRLIAAHNTDETAHIGVGQSLSQHKLEAVIDHAVGSVVADKLTFTEGLCEAGFESFDNWSITGVVSSQGWPGANLYILKNETDLSIIESVVTHPGNWLNYAKNLCFQFSAWVDTDTVNFKAHLMLGGYNSDTNLEGFGFRIAGAEVKAFWGKGATISWSADLAIDTSLGHIYRAQYDSVDKVVRFYIDGVIKATLTLVTPTDFEPSIYFRLEQNGTVETNLKIQKVLVSRLF